MKIGLSTACFFNRLFTEDALRAVRDLGIETTECFFGTCSEYRPPLLDAIAREARSLDVRSAHAMCTQFEPQLFAENPRQRADGTAFLEEFLHAASAVGARFYTFHGPLLLKKKAYVLNYDAIASVVNGLTDTTARAGIALSYENVHYSYAASPKFFEEILPRCPALRTTLDVKQAAQAGGSYREFLPVMGTRLSTVHVCDVRGTDTCLPGRGELDFVALFSSLKEIGFDGAVVLECYKTDYESFDELRRAVEYLREAEAKTR